MCKGTLVSKRFCALVKRVEGALLADTFAQTRSSDFPGSAPITSASFSREKRFNVSIAKIPLDGRLSLVSFLFLDPPVVDVIFGLR